MTDSKHTPGPRCRRKNRGGHCRSPVYTMNAQGEATCFYHARPEEIADVRSREVQCRDFAGELLPVSIHREPDCSGPYWSKS